MAAVETSGRTSATPSPRSGHTAPNRWAELKPCCRTPRGRTPFWYQMWVTPPFCPILASSRTGFRGHRAVDQDLAVGGFGTKAGRQVAHGADRGVVETALEADPAERRDAFRAPDAKAEPVAFPLPVPGQVGHAPAHRHRHPDRPRGRVGARQG